jgi:hypothetical protein
MTLLKVPLHPSPILNLIPIALGSTAGLVLEACGSANARQSGRVSDYFRA